MWRLLLATVGVTVAGGAPSQIWTGTLRPMTDMVVTGSVELEPVGADSTRAVVTISEAQPGATLPWHLHAGSCATIGSVVGNPAHYPPIRIGARRSGVVTVTLPMATPKGGAYAVQVHASPSNMKTVLACGELRVEGDA